MGSAIQRPSKAVYRNDALMKKPRKQSNEPAQWTVYMMRANLTWMAQLRRATRPKPWPRPSSSLKSGQQISGASAY